MNLLQTNNNTRLLHGNTIQLYPISLHFSGIIRTISVSINLSFSIYLALCSVVFIHCDNLKMALRLYCKHNWKEISHKSAFCKTTELIIVSVKQKR